MPPGATKAQASARAGLNPPGGVSLASDLGRERGRRRGGDALQRKIECSLCMYQRRMVVMRQCTLSCPSKVVPTALQKNTYSERQQALQSLFSLSLSPPSPEKFPERAHGSCAPWRLLPASDGPRVGMLSSGEEVAEARHRTFRGGPQVSSLLRSIYTQRISKPKKSRLKNAF